MIFAWYFSDPNILISSYITDDSRIMFRRTIQERVETVAPFFCSTATPTSWSARADCSGCRMRIRGATTSLCEPICDQRKAQLYSQFREGRH